MVKLIATLLAYLNIVLSLLGVSSGNEAKWKLNGIPSYDGGYLCSNVYNDGSGLESEEEGATGVESKMQIAGGTSLEDFSSYCKKLEENGFEKVFGNVIDQTHSAAFRSDSKLVYTYYCDRTREARIIEDNSTNCFEGFGYTCSEGEAATVYQFDYPYADPDEKSNEEIYSTNGMMYIIRLADNSLIVIDGGSIRQSSDKNIDECMKFMHKITGTAEGEAVRISLWYGTHGHSDHVTFFYKLLGYHHAEIDLERVMFNYPALELIEHDGRIDMFRDRLAKLYPDVSYLKPHTGYSFNIANARLDILYTHEDAVSPITGKTPIKNTNDGSVASMITVGGKKLLVLGDMNLIAQDRIVKMYDKSVVKTDIVQAAHHLYNSVAILYDWADPLYAFCPTSQGRAQMGQVGYTAIRLFLKEEQLLYADDALYGIEMRSDGLRLSVQHTDCVPYDDSSMNKVK